MGFFFHSDFFRKSKKSLRRLSMISLIVNSSFESVTERERSL